MSEGLRVGIIGAGWAATAHAQAYGRLSKVEVAGLWSRSRSRAQGLVEKLGLSDAGVYDDWEGMIEGADLDAISVTTPAALRVEPIRMALARGIHVLVEKPFTVDVAQANELVDLAEKSEPVTAVCFNWRYSPGNQVARDVIQSGKLGKLRSLRIVWRLRWTGDLQSTKAYFESKPWERNPETGGGLLRNVASGCNLLAELSNGALAEVCVMTTAGQNERAATYVGEDGSLTATHETVVRQCRDDKDPVELTVPDRDTVEDGVGLLPHTLNRLVEDFCKTARDGDREHLKAPSLPSFVDGLHCQRLIAAAEGSDVDGRWVEPGELT